MPAIDHSALLLDAPAMGAKLQASLPRLRGEKLRTCRIHQTRRRISRKTEELGAPYLGVVYELQPPGDAPTPVAHWCYVKAYSRGASRTAGDAQTALRLDDLDALAWWLPHDPAMPHLAAFLDPHRVRSELRRLPGGSGDATAPAVAIVRHEPESHCTARFEWTLHGRRAVYGKTYADDRWTRAARRMQALWTASVDDRAFAIARPLGSSRVLRAVWQQEAHGVALREQLRGVRAESWLARVADALAALHGGASTGDAALAPHDLLARATKHCRKLARADASLAGALDPVLASLRSSVPDLTAAVAAHGDFHVDQMLCAGERVVLFDFDNFVAGSPALDVADFASQLLSDADFDAQRRSELAAGFIDLCMTRLPQPPRRAELDWHLRALLLRKAYSFFVRHRAGWRERVREAVALAACGLRSVR